MSRAEEPTEDFSIPNTILRKIGLEISANMDELAYELGVKPAQLENYKKMNISDPFSALFLRSDLPSTKKVLKTQPAFKVKLQEEEHKYELYTWTTANGSTEL